MICGKCQTAVDDDLVFCTNCGARLYEPADASAPTIAMSDSVVTQVAARQSKKSSPLKWVALIAVLVALLAGLGITYLMTKNQTIVNMSNADKNAPVVRKNNANAIDKNTNSVASNSITGNAVVENTNGANKNPTSNSEPTVIFDEQIEIAAGTHIAYPFKADGNVKISGKIDTVRGEPLKGYFYIQYVYDEHFPDANFKVSGFDVKDAEIRQYLVGGDYVLVFVNESKFSAVVKGKLEMQPNE